MKLIDDYFYLIIVFVGCIFPIVVSYTRLHDVSPKFKKFFVFLSYICVYFVTIPISLVINIIRGEPPESHIFVYGIVFMGIHYFLLRYIKERRLKK